MRYRPEYDMQLIGRNLKRLREKQHLTVDQVREYLCLGSVQAVYKYEKGKCFPQADTMFALMELYNANIADLTRSYEAEDEMSSAFHFFEKFSKNRKQRISLSFPCVKYAFLV